MKKSILTIALVFVALAAMAEDTGEIIGTIIDRSTRQGIQQASLTLCKEGVELQKVQTTPQGAFKFPEVADGSYEINVNAKEYISTTVFCIVEKGLLRDLRTISLTPDKVVEETDDASFSEFDMNDSGYSNNPTVLTGSNDPFTSVASFGFSNMRWRPRGFESGTQDVYLAGVRINDAMTGYTPYALWSGLNEATRSKNSEHGMGAVDYSIGGYNGITNIEANAASVRKGWRFSALTNSALYRLRLMATYASGPLDNGWSYAFNVSARLGGNDWTKGVYYRSFAFYAGAEKKFDDGRHNLSFAAFATPGKRGAQTASTQEVYDLMGDNNYNANWGYQDGKIRNARERRTFEPVMFVKYTFKPDDDLVANATVLYRTGWNGYTALDWFNAADPRPDYYKNLPSYFFMGEDGEEYGKEAELKAGYAKEQWKLHNTNYCHVDWDRMYNINKNSRDVYSETEARSRYVQEERHVDQNDVNLALQTKWHQSSLLTLRVGLNGKINRTEYYKKIADLLGGDYYVNVNNFAERDFASYEYKYQQDLDYYVANGHAQVVRTGDKYGYDYYANIYRINYWLMGSFDVGNFKADLAYETGGVMFWRDGVWRNGLFAGYKDGTTEPYTLNGVDITVKDGSGRIITSKGKSDVASFYTYRAKLKLSYNFRGGHIIWANIGYFNDAPEFSLSFISPRTRNSLIPNLTTMKTSSMDLNYQWAANGYNVRVTGFYTKIEDKTDLLSFYDDMQASFTNVAMWGIGERHAGVELGFVIPLVLDGLSLKGALSYSNNVYTKNPYMTQTVDNSAQTVVENVEVPYWTGTPPTFKQNSDGSYEKDLDGNYIETGRVAHHVSGSPELASSLSLNYRTKTYWFFTIEGQAFAGNYLDMNPLYRTTAACAGPTGKNLTPESIKYMTTQEVFAPAFLLNASVGKSWYLQYKYNFGFSLNLNNILNDRNIKTGGYEQTRLIKGSESYKRFDPKYFYMTGINYMLNLYFKF